MRRSLHLLGLCAERPTTTAPHTADVVAERIHTAYASRRPDAGLLVVNSGRGPELYLDGTAADIEQLHSIATEVGAPLGSGRFALIDDAAVAHLFRSAAGLESPILGDTQTLAQLRIAANRSRNHRALSAVLAEVVDRALVLGQEVRRATGIADGRADIGGAIARTIDERGLTFAPVVIVGSGDTAVRTLAAFDQAPRPVAIIGGDRSEAVSLSRAFDATMIESEQLPRWAGSVCVITTTQIPAEAHTLTDRARLVIDAVPEGTSVASDLHRDDLSDWSDPRRLAAVAPATDLCDEAVDRWRAWNDRRPFETAVGTLYRDLDRLVDELEAGDAAIAVRSVVRSWLGPHVTALRNALTSPPSDPESLQEIL